MKALSIRQPWAWLIVHGHKDVENRTWATNYRGPLLVHAGLTLDPDHARAAELAQEQGIALPATPELPRGAIVGRVRIVDCVDWHPSPWFQGPYAFVLEDAEPLEPVPFRGMLGLFNGPDLPETG
jgi:hypothetical protein